MRVPIPGNPAVPGMFRKPPHCFGGGETGNGCPMDVDWIPKWMSIDLGKGMEANGDGLSSARRHWLIPLAIPYDRSFALAILRVNPIEPIVSPDFQLKLPKMHCDNLGFHPLLGLNGHPIGMSPLLYHFEDRDQDIWLKVASMKIARLRCVAMEWDADRIGVVPGRIVQMYDHRKNTWTRIADLHQEHVSPATGLLTDCPNGDD